MRVHELFGRGDHRGQRALHVGGAAPEQMSVANGGLERIALPFLERARRNDVGVAGETQHRPAAAARRPEIVDVAITQVFDLETVPGEAARHDFLAALVGGSHGVARDEIEREIDGG